MVEKRLNEYERAELIKRIADDEEKLEKSHDLILKLSEDLEKQRVIGNQNLPVIVKYFFIFAFFAIIGIFSPDTLIKIVNIIVSRF